MTGSELFREIGNISEEYILEAENYQKKAANSAAVRKTLTAAACFAVCVGLVFLVQKTGIGFDTAKSESITEKAYDAESVMEASKAPTSNMMVEQKEELKEECAEEEAYVIIEDTEAKSEEQKVDQGEVKVETGTPEGIEIGDGLVELEKYDSVMVKERLAEYPNDYKALLQEEDALVVFMGEVQNGQEKWEAFLESVKSGEVAQIDVIVFSIEGDAIIRNIYFDGSVYWLCNDSTRDAYRGTEAYYEKAFQYLQCVEKEWEDGKETVEYVLTDQKEENQLADIAEFLVFQIYK